jgi:hypothetical protein
MSECLAAKAPGLAILGLSLPSRNPCFPLHGNDMRDNAIALPQFNGPSCAKPRFESARVTQLT